MNSYLEQFAINVLQANRISCVRICSAEPKAFDYGLRTAVYSDLAYLPILTQIERKTQQKTIYYWVDSFECSYIVLSIPDESDHYMIGPYTTRKHDPSDIDRLFQKYHLSSDRISVFARIYQGIPVVGDELFLVNFVKVFAGELYGGSYDYTSLEIIDYLDESPINVAQDSDPFVNQSQQIEQGYFVMNQILAEVRKGNAASAIHYLNDFYALVVNRSRFQDKLKDAQNWLIVFNTSLRLSIQQVGIHPYYIDDISSRFSFRINDLSNGNQKDMFEFMEEMIQRYCQLVNSYSTAPYSDLIQKTILEIRINLSSELTLSSLAQKLHVSTSYLSRLFHKEVGMSLTEYIHRTRVDESLVYINQTQEPVKNIIHLVGIYDYNYFTKLFKRYIGMSPNEYRKMLKGRSM
jgi:AraC-like DNA-binding protein